MIVWINIATSSNVREDGFILACGSRALFSTLTEAWLAGVRGSLLNCTLIQEAERGTLLLIWLRLAFLLFGTRSIGCCCPHSGTSLPYQLSLSGGTHSHTSSVFSEISKCSPTDTSARPLSIFSDTPYQPISISEGHWQDTEVEKVHSIVCCWLA